MVPYTNMIEAVLFSCALLGKQEICRLTPGQAALVWHPQSRETGTLFDVTVSRTIIQTFHDEDGVAWMAPVAGKDMVSPFRLDNVDALEAPNINIKTRIGAVEPSFWAAQRATKSRREAVSWGPITGRSISRLFDGGLHDTDTDKKSCITPHLGVVTKTAIDQHSRIVWLVTGGGALYWTPLMPASAMPYDNGAGGLTVLPSAQVDVYRQSLDLLMAMGLPVAIGWANTRSEKIGLVSMQEFTPQRPIPTAEGENRIARDAGLAKARQVARDLDMPELETLAVSGEGAVSEGFRVFLGTADGRAAEGTLEEEITQAMSCAVRGCANPVWSVPSGAGNPYAGVYESELNGLKTGFNRLASRLQFA